MQLCARTPEDQDNPCGKPSRRRETLLINSLTIARKCSIRTVSLFPRRGDRSTMTKNQWHGLTRCETPSRNVRRTCSKKTQWNHFAVS